MNPEPQNSAAVESAEAAEARLPEPVRTWNETRTAYPREKTVAQLFEEIAFQYPGRVATVFGGTELTYAELNARANRLAHRLIRSGIEPESLVGCCVERSHEMIVAFLAVLKAGAAYVPLDPAYPKERLKFLLEDTRTPLLVTQKHLANTILAEAALPLIFAGQDESGSGGTDDENPQRSKDPLTLAYVMYTSGSTGLPKGVMVENRAIVRLVRNTNFCQFGPGEVFLQLAPELFDASTLEIWGPLLNGGKLVIPPAHAASLEDIGRLIREHGVTTLWLTSGLFNLMVEQRLEDLRPIRQLLAGGDVLSPRHVRTVLENLPECVVINGYGPTENTTFTCCHAMRSGESVAESVPIGKPVSNTQVYILDDQMNPVAPGITGEIYAAGDGVARGYLNNPAATAEKFIPDPFATDPRQRMYKTGDLGRWREDGTIEFAGRIDNQVKIQGYRIEPGEIETVLRIHESLKQVCVVPRSDEGGVKKLVAYVVPSENRTVSSQELRSFLAGKLPQFMVPSLFVELKAFPLTPNGKVDRSALPAPVFAARSEHEGEERASGTEQTIVTLWKRVLRLDYVGLDDNFFDLGGDSLLLVAVHSNLQKSLQMNIQVTDLFEFTTIRTLAKHLDGATSAAPAISETQERARKQREAFALERQRRTGGGM
jgi:aspartate racemase